MNKTKLIPPFVMLAATSLVAVITYLRDFPFGTWLIIVFGVMVLFLFIGEILRQLIEVFYNNNLKKEQEEEAKRAQEEQAEAESGEAGNTAI